MDCLCHSKYFAINMTTMGRLEKVNWHCTWLPVDKMWKIAVKFGHGCDKIRLCSLGEKNVSKMIINKLQQYFWLILSLYWVVGLFFGGHLFVCSMFLLLHDSAFHSWSCAITFLYLLAFACSISCVSENGSFLSNFRGKSMPPSSKFKMADRQTVQHHITSHDN